jgi:predicted ArsR family transcriptional regulator
MPSGESTKVDDNRILIEFLLNPAPALYASDIAANLPVTRQTVQNRLEAMEQPEDGPPLVTSRKASGRRSWWLTTAGREQATSYAREQLGSNS